MINPRRTYELNHLAAGEMVVHDPHGFLVALRLRQFVQTRGDLLAVTDLGRAYLAARDGRRIATTAHVELVDVEENTARVLVDAWSQDQAVTVLLDQLAHAVGLEAYELPGLWLDVTANVDAERAEEVVLTGIRPRPAPLPDSWRKDAAPADLEGEGADGD